MTESLNNTIQKIHFLRKFLGLEYPNIAKEEVHLEQIFLSIVEGNSQLTLKPLCRLRTSREERFRNLQVH